MSKCRLIFIAPPQSVTGIFQELKDADIEVSIAENLKGAAQAIRKGEPALIFARPQMQGFDVEELLAAAGRAPGFPPVIVITDLRPYLKKQKHTKSTFH